MADPRRTGSGGARIVVLSVGLAVLLLLLLLAMLAMPTVQEYRRAEITGRERAGLAAAGYAERVASLLERADHLAASAARLSGFREQDEGFSVLRDSLVRDVRWNAALDGYVTVTAEGQILDRFLKGRTDLRAFSGPVTVSRNRDHWSGPVVRVARPIGREAWFLALERGEWTQDGAFSGAGVAFLSLESALREAVVGRLFENALIRLQDLDGTLLFESRSAEGDAAQIWLPPQRHRAVLDLSANDTLTGVETGRDAGLFLASQRVPGLPLMVSVQIPETVFMRDAEHSLKMVLGVAAGAAVMTLLILTVILRDRVMQSLAERRLREAEERLRFALFAGGLSLWELWFDSGRMELADRVIAALGYRRAAWPLRLSTALRRMHPDDRRALRTLWQSLRDGGLSRCSVDIRLRTAAGDWVWQRVDGRVAERRPDGVPLRMVGVLHDVSAEKGREETLTFAATHDPLLGLLNRQVFDEACRAPCGPEAPCAMIVFDIDHFKRVNDSFGHAAGDQVLRTVAARVRGALRGEEQARLFRIGGEEFVLLLPATGGAAAAAVADRLRRAVGGQPMAAGHAVLTVTASFGVCGSDQIAALTVGDLFGPADAALYAAKDGGRDQVVLHHPGALLVGQPVGG